MKDPRRAGSGMDEPGGLRVVPFEGSAAEWDSALERFHEATFCHLGGWRRVMSDSLGHTPHFRIALDEVGTIQGLLPMVRVKSRLFGDYLVSMPFLSYGGPLGSEKARSVLAVDAARKAKDLGVDLLELRSRTALDTPLSVSQRKLTVLMDLPETPEILWEKGLKAKVRSQIRRPIKEGMKPEFGLTQLDGFYGVFSRTMRDLGTPVLPRRFFDAVAEELSSQVVFCTIRLGDQPVAAGCGFLWNGEFEITWAGSLREFNRLAPNMLLYWSLMEEAIDRGAHVFNFGRCTEGSGTHRFKKQWGGKDHPLPWAQWSKGSIDATPAPAGRKFELATSVWRRLPLPVANQLGPMIARKLP